MMDKPKQLYEDIADRREVFYWQTDRKISQEEIAAIWSDRHSGFTDEEVIQKVNTFSDQKLSELEPLENSGTNLGNINSVRKAKNEDGTDSIIRLHPKGVCNGYFFVESLVARRLLENNLPSYKTFCIHDCENAEDFAFQQIQTLPGIPVKTWLEKSPEDETKLVAEVGRTLAQMHRIKVEGFGPFNNELAKQGTLKGLHDSFASSLNASLSSNLSVLIEKELISQQQSHAISSLFEPSNELLQIEESVFVHNDFADWNQLTDGQSISGIIDLDEAIGSSPVSDIACWSVFFPPERMQILLNGYFENSPDIENFVELFQLLRLRYVVSKMTMRLRKLSWDKSSFLKELINSGTQHLEESLSYFKI